MSSEKENLDLTKKILLNHRSKWQKLVDWVDENKVLSWLFLIFGSPLLLIPTIIFAVALSDKPSYSFVDPFVTKLNSTDFSDLNAPKSFSALLTQMDQPVRVAAEQLIQARKTVFEQQVKTQNEKKAFDESPVGKAVSKILLALEKAPSGFPLSKRDVVKEDGTLLVENLRAENDLNTLSFAQYYSHVTGSPSLAFGHEKVAKNKVVTFTELMVEIFEMEELAWEEDGPHRTDVDGMTNGSFVCDLTAENLKKIINFDPVALEKNAAQFYGKWEKDKQKKESLTGSNEATANSKSPFFQPIASEAKTPDAQQPSNDPNKTLEQ